MPFLSLLKLVIKKMAAICGALYFMCLAPPPPLSLSDKPGPDAAMSQPMLGNQCTDGLIDIGVDIDYKIPQ